jgi:hypothetical protein
MPDYLMCHVYSPATGGDCTNGGITSKNNFVALELPDGTAGLPRSYTGHLPVVRIVRRQIAGREYVHAVPKDIPGHFMFGGNFIYTSDSRFPFDYPIAVHDRVE